MMTISTKKWSLFAVCATALLTGAQHPAEAQAAARAKTTASSARFSVDIKDATLMDALELVFMAANERSYSIDAAAKSVRVGTLSFKDQPWRDIVRTLTSLNKFRFARTNGVWVVEPRASNVSGNAIYGTSTRDSAKQSDFSVETRGSAQQQPTGGTTGSLPIPTAVDSNSPWTIIEPQHTYSGAIALFFRGGVVITTQEIIVPSAALSTRLGGQLLSRPGYVRKDPESNAGQNNNNNNQNNNNNNNNNR